MRLNRLILFATTVTAAATAGTAFAQTSTENPPSAPPDTEVQPAPTTVQPAPGTVQPTPEMAQPAPEMAQPPPAEPVPMTAPPPPVAYPAYPAHVTDMPPPPAHERWWPMSQIGVGLFAGGGVTDYTNSVARNQTNTGGSWTARITAGTRGFVGVEGSYIGGANTVVGLGNSNATLVRNGLEGALRINIPIYAQSTLLEPYISGGAGWNSYHVTNYSSRASASFTSGTDNTVSIPLAAGFTVGYRGFLADLRYTIRPTYDQNIFLTQSSSALSNWDAGGMIGYEF
jgi:hypothetical protein